MSQNSNITFADVETSSDKPWNWDNLSKNPGITFEDVKANPDKPWSWDYLSWNPNITFEDINANFDKPWNWAHLSGNKFKHDPILQQIKLKKLASIRQKNKKLNETLKFNFWRLYYISKTREFCQWYYHPENGGGKISKNRIMGVLNTPK